METPAGCSGKDVSAEVHNGVRRVARGECGEVASGGARVASGGERVASGGARGVPAIHRGQLPPPECLTARGSAHDGTNLLHRGQQTYSEPPLWQVVAHGELQELPEEDLLGEETIGEGKMLFTASFSVGQFVLSVIRFSIIIGIRWDCARPGGLRIPIAAHRGGP